MPLLMIPHQLFTCEQIRKAELDLVKAKSVSLFDLVERAAQSACEALLKIRQPGCVLVLAGSGNNGSDALMMAAFLHEHGYPCRVMRLESRRYSDENQEAYERLTGLGIQVETLDCAALAKAVSEYDTLVDGLLGTGVSGEPRSGITRLIELINQADNFVFSLDIPSGINGDTGRAIGCVVKADATICFGAVKQGLLTSDARDACGDIYFGEIGLSPVLPKPVAFWRNGQELKQMLKPRSQNSHKGTHGKVCVVGGDQGMAGAVRMAGEACLRAGAGLVTVISRPEHLPLVSIPRPELMFQGCELADMETYEKLGWADVIVLGPGLGTRDWGYNLFKAVALCDKPALVDADGLNLLAIYPDKSAIRVITPHPAEAARLLGCQTEEIEADRFTAIRALQAKYGGVVVLKGAGSLIYDGETLVVAPVGNPGLASGGCGDVLSGIIGALMAQGLDFQSAAVAGVIIHGDAADLAARYGERGMLASDLMDGIRLKVNPVPD